MRYFTQRSYQLASIILPVSDSLVYTENTYYSDKVLKFGYTHHLSNIKTPYKVIPNGLIIKDWQRDANIVKENASFMTVLEEGKLLIKGVDLIIQAATNLPNCKFYFVGIDYIEERATIPSNIICLGRLNPEELNNLYSKTQFYLQLSNTEGFGVALCEAMLCECVPIVSNVNYLPTIVAETGFVLKKRSVTLLEILINKALTADLEQLGKEARIRIIENFSVDNRELLLITELTAK
jgi:glycosyltransferase involved in cell wall biosynthesis